MRQSNHIPWQPPSTELRLRQAWLILAGYWLIVLAWDVSGMDIPLATIMGGNTAFEWKDNFWLSQVFHQGARQFFTALAAITFVNIFLPIGHFFRQTSQRGRIWCVCTMLVCTLSISGLKRISTTSCPWDLHIFDGTLPYLSHWALNVSDGGSGHCFPAGHASAAFAFLPFGWLVYARFGRIRWLLLVTLAGFFLGVVQQFRGAHFMSHTLWTAGLCATITLTSWQLIGKRVFRV